MGTGPRRERDFDTIHEAKKTCKAATKSVPAPTAEMDDFRPTCDHRSRNSIARASGVSQARRVLYTETQQRGSPFPRGAKTEFEDEVPEDEIRP